LCPLCITVEWESKSFRREIFRKHEIDEAYWWLDRILELFAQARSSCKLIASMYIYTHAHAHARAHTHTHTHAHTHWTFLIILSILCKRGAKTKIAFCAAQVRARVSRRVVFKTHGRINYTFLNVSSIYFIVIFLYKQQDLTQRNTKYILEHFCVYEYAHSPRDIQMSGYLYRTFFIWKLLK